MRQHQSYARDSWLGLREASRRLGVHETTLRRWADSGAVGVFVTPGGHRRFMASEIARCAQEHWYRPGSSTFATTSWTDRAMLTARHDISQQPWSVTYGDGEREVNRTLGRRLMGLLLQFVASPEEDSALLGEARLIGQEKARSGRRLGLTLLGIIQGLSFFRRTLLETVIGEFSEELSRPKEANILLIRRIDTLLSEVETGVVEAYADQR